MSKLQIIDAKTMEKLLLKLGFHQRRQKGSHTFFRHKDYSMEEFYDKDLQRYYDSLQMDLNHNYYFGRNNADLTIWVTYFLDVMGEVFENISKKSFEFV